MKFKVNRDHFSNGLNQVLNVVGTRPTMPILRNVLIEASDGTVTLRTTNLDLAIRCTIKADVEEEGGLTLPVRKLASIVRELPNLDVFVETDSKPSAHIKSGGSKYQIVGIAGEEFPPCPRLTISTSSLFRRKMCSECSAAFPMRNRAMRAGIFSTVCSSILRRTS